MAASLKFESAKGTRATDLSKVKVITLTDQSNNTYTLDVTGNDLKVAYKPHSGTATEYTVNGLAPALESLLSTKDKDKSVLVDTLGEFLGSSDKANYDGQSNQTAKEFLGGKGLKGEKGEKGDPGADGKDGTSPSAAEIAAEQALQEHVAKISIQSPALKKAVQEEMPLPLEIPTSDDAALNWTW